MISMEDYEKILVNSYIEEGFPEPATNSTDLMIISLISDCATVWDDSADCFASWSRLLADAAKKVESLKRGV